MRKGFLRIGGGSACGSDRIEPAAELADRGELEYLVFDSISEETILNHVDDRKRNPSKGYDFHLERRMRSVLVTCAKRKVIIIGNMGSANPEAAVDILSDWAEN